MDMNYELLIENSIKTDSNLVKMFEQLNLEETNSATNFSNYKALVTRVIRRMQETSDFDYFCTTITTTSPNGVIPVYGEKLVGKKSDDKRVSDDIKVFQFNEQIPDAVGATITNGTGGNGLVLYKDGVFALVEVTSGTFASGDTISTKTLQEIYINVHSMGSLLEGYSGNYSLKDGEELIDSNEIDFQLILSEIECTSKILRTGITREALSDLIRMYGVTKSNSIEKSLTECILSRTRQNIFNFMKSNAVQRSDIVLLNSLGSTSGLNNIFSDLYTRIRNSIGRIGTQTGISGGKYFVVASSNVFNAIVTYMKEAVYNRNGITFLPDDVSLIEDGYSVNDYMLVGLRGPKNNAAVIFSPYSIDIQSVTDPETFKERIGILSRSDIINNPLYELSGYTSNPMMEYTVVDTKNIQNFL